MSSVKLYVCNPSCVLNCAMFLYKLQTLLKSHLLITNEIIWARKISLRKKFPVFMYFPGKTAPCYWLYFSNYWILFLLWFLSLKNTYTFNYWSIIRKTMFVSLSVCVWMCSKDIPLRAELQPLAGRHMHVWSYAIQNQVL